MLHEPTVLPDEFVMGVDHFEWVGSANVRVVCYNEQPAPDGTVERQAVKKIVVPVDGLFDAVKLAVVFLGGAVTRTIVSVADKFRTMH